MSSITKGDSPLKSPSIQTSADEGSVRTCSPLLLPGGFWLGSCGGLPEDRAGAFCAATTFPSVAPLLVAHDAASRTTDAQRAAATIRRAGARCESAQARANPRKRGAREPS